MLKNLVGAAALFALATLAIHNPAQAQELVVNGSTVVANALMIPMETAIETASNQQIRIVPTGSHHGVKALADGSADLAMISAPLGAVIANMNERRRDQPINGRDYVAHRVGANYVAFVLNHTNPVRSLTPDQLYDVLAGRITNWAEVGGLNMPINLMAEQPGGGTRTVVEERLAQWGDLLDTHSSMQSVPIVLLGVAREQGALGIVSLADINGTVAKLDVDEVLAQPLFLVTRGQPDSRSAAVIQAARSVSGHQDNTTSTDALAPSDVAVQQN